MRTESSKIIFFDIDGTLIGMDGIISSRLVEALTKVQANGHKICIATGRSLDEKVRELKQLNWDGYILANGAYGEYNNELIMSEVISEQYVRDFVEYAKTLSGVGLIVEGNEGAYTTKEDGEIASALMSKLTQGKLTRTMFFDYFDIVSDLGAVKGVNKIMYFDGEEYIEDFRAKFGDELDFLPNSVTQSGGWDTAEIMKKGITKASGIQKIINRAGYRQEDVIAFGDGYNDIEMIQYANIGVAMGNGVDALKEQADLVADTQANDGVVKMLETLNLIN